jgi:hypothetical protein
VTSVAKELCALSDCDAADLGELVRAVALIPGEALIDGWAADRLVQDGRDPGAVVVTSERLLFTAKSGQIVAMPIGQIYSLEADDSHGVIATVWYQVLRVIFENDQTRDLILNLLRQRLAAHLASKSAPDRLRAPQIVR